MVRNYVKKTKPHYTKEMLAEALAEIKAGRMTVYRASKHYKIPKNTISDRIRGKSGQKSESRGRNTVLSRENEKSLSDGLLTLEKYGFGLSRKEMLLLVGQFVKKNNLETPFKDGVPGEDWFLGFKKRNNLSLKKAQGVEIARRGGCNPITIQNYFNLLESTIKELNLENSPSRIWNLDETSFCTDPSKTKIVGAKNKPCTRTISAPGKSSTSSAQLVENCNVSFENLLLETITSNFTEIVKKKKRVAKGAEVITSEETKLRLFPDKNIKEKTPNSSFKEDDNLCSICKCDFRCYTNKKAWIQCINCMNWVCGNCNKGSKKKTI